MMEISARCPNCGLELTIMGSGTCLGCKHEYRLSDNLTTVDWRTAENGPRKRNLSSWIRTFLNPLVTPILPFRYITKVRVEAYYRRILKDKNLATKWFRHYIGGLGIQEGSRFLDHGCGRGRSLALLTSCGMVSYGQEISTNAWWTNLPASNFQVVSPEHHLLPWGNDSFDCVTDFMVIGHFETESLKTLASESARILKSGGHWVILEANDSSYGSHYPRKHYGRLHSLDDVIKIATAAGFDIVDVQYEGFYAPIFPNIFNYVRKQLSPLPLDLSDFGGFIEKTVQPNKRGLWLLRLKKRS